MSVAEPAPRGLLAGALPYVVALLLSIGLAAAVWPGNMSVDTIVTLTQGEKGITDSSNPVLVVYSWRLLQEIARSPGAILLTHLIILFLAMAHFLKGRGIPPLAVGLLLALICIWPYFLGKVVVIWRDVSVTALLTAGLAILADAARRDSRWLVFLGLGFIFLAAGYRHDAWIAALPFWAWAGWLLLERPALRSAAAMGRLAALFLAITAINLTAVWAVNHRDVPSNNLWRKTALFDLIGTSHYARVNLLPPYLYAQHEAFTLEDLDGLYFIEVVTKSFQRFPDNQGRKLLRDEKRDPEKLSALSGAWIAAIREHPLAYLRHRLNFAAVFLGLTGEPAYAPTHYGISPNDLGLVFEPGPGGELVLRWILATGSTFLQRPWVFYALGLAALIVLLLRRPPGGVTAAVPLVSGFFHGGALTLLVHAADSRYHLWALLAMVLGVMAAVQAVVAGSRSHMRHRPLRESHREASHPTDHGRRSP